MSEETPREKLLELVEEFHSGMLTTRAINGDLRSRPMAVAKVDPDGDLYFSTDVHSAKTDEIQANPAVNVSFQSNSVYVSVSGRAEVLNDRALIDELWAPDWKIWFPKGKDDPDIRIIKVEARRGEYWDVSGANALRFLWEAGKAIVTGEEQEDVGNEKVEL
jgi:general stress protein 26